MAGVITRRGHFVSVVVPGAYGKPRPAVVVQSDLFDALPSVTICPLTSSLRSDADILRLTVEPTADNGLRALSQIMIDKITTVPRDKIGNVIGRADNALMLRIERSVAIFLGIA